MATNELILVFGAGGHGIEPLRNYIDSTSSQVIVSYVPADYGGNTGSVLRLLRLNNSSLNLELHLDSNHPVLPFGDFNKFISHNLQEFIFNSNSLEKNSEINKVLSKNRQILNFRSDDQEKLIQASNTLAIIFQQDNRDKEEFASYLNHYIRIYLKHKSNQEYKLSTNCLGNIWHQYRYYRDGGIHGINRFYQQRGLLKFNQKLLFTYDEQLILVGSTIIDEFLLGEDQVDVAQKAILPNTLKLLDVTGKSFGSLVSEEWLEILENSSLVIIPTGSIANWLCLINSSATVRRILHKKGREGRVVLIANLFYSPNEFRFEAYLELIIENYGIPLQILTPDPTKLQQLYKQNPNLLQNYLNEGKRPNTFDSSRYNHLKNNPILGVDTSLSCQTGGVVEGIKYNPISITNALQKLYPLFF